MSIDGELKPRSENVWGNKDAGNGNFSPKSFTNGDESEIDYLIKPINTIPAANDPTLRDVTPKSFTRSAVETDNSVLKQLLGNSELELETGLNLKPTFSADNDPTSPTGSQINAIKDIYEGTRDSNLNRVTPAPMKAGREIPGDINDAPAVLTKGISSWQEPTPLRADKPKSGLKLFLRRFFG